jgi:hypothetical protein
MIRRVFAPIANIQGAPLRWPLIRSRALRPLARSGLAHRRWESVLVRTTAVEMTRLWKSQNDFHSRLEIAHRTRDFHIPTAASRVSSKKTEDRRHRLDTGHVSRGGATLPTGW